MAKPTLYVFPTCPYAQRVSVIAKLKGSDLLNIVDIDPSKPRSAEFLKKSGGSTAVPLLETSDGRILRESLVLMTYLDEALPGPTIRRADPYEHAIERIFLTRADALFSASYVFLNNQKAEARQALLDKILSILEDLNKLLLEHNPLGTTFLFDKFGLVEAAFAPGFQRLWYLEYFENFSIPNDTAKYGRVSAWIKACRAHPAANQVNEEQIVKTSYDLAMGSIGSTVPPGRTRSVAGWETDWRQRPYPPKDHKYTDKRATDKELGLVD